MRQLIIASFVGIGLWAPSASAATISFSDLQPLADADISGVLSVPRFDATLGTLVGVSWSMTGATASILGITNNSAGPVSGSASTEVEFNLSAAELSLAASPDFSVVASTGAVVLSAGESALFPLTSSFTLTGTEAASGAFVGPGTIDLSYFTITAFGGRGFGSDITISQATDAGLKFDITYEFAIVPLPAALPMMLAALAGLGGLATRRRT
jgi:hypothetical protein